MPASETFRVSSHLKDVIGRDLVTNEFVALFELVKNSFDAKATAVDIEFNPQERTIAVVDNGRGMSSTDIRSKWLFVAYSEKALSGSSDYRDKIRPAGGFAGSKGIGRFACDTLGRQLDLYSRAQGESLISKLQVDWTDFESKSTDHFQEITVSLDHVPSFPPLVHVSPPEDGGTVLLIKDVRHTWDADAIRRLRRDLAKFVDPFGTTSDIIVSTWLVDGTSDAIEGVDGPIGNNIAELLRDKTSRIEVSIADEKIETTLYDRGRKIYSIREPSPYPELEAAQVSGRVFFLNRSAKHTFKLRMGVSSVEFGSVFLFLNGFRVLPIGDEFDDTFGLNRRKQQGQSRFLGTRDIIGRVDVAAPPKMFREVSSRDAGLVDDANRRALYEAIRRHMLFRLERYVVGVNWADKADQGRDTPEGLETDSARGRVLAIVGGLARSKDVEILYFDDQLVRMSENPDQVTDAALRAMSDLAGRSGNSTLLAHVEETQRRIAQLRSQREEARQAAQRAIEERDRADARIARLEQQAAFLGSSRDLNIERVQLLMHQATIHAGHVRSAMANAAYEIRNLLSLAAEQDRLEDLDDVADLLASIRQSARRVSVSIASATLSGERLGAALSFAPNIRVDLETDKVKGDLLLFLAEYFNVRLDGIHDMPKALFHNPGLSLRREFSPVDMAVLVDNLQDNARKARASKIEFAVARKGANRVAIRVTDDGTGINVDKVDPTKLFERGYTSSHNGTGLGLYSVRQILQEMGGSIELVGDGSRADFEVIIPGDLG
jgi:signal transduction histidine kinase